VVGMELPVLLRVAVGRWRRPWRRGKHMHRRPSSCWRGQRARQTLRRRVGSLPRGCHGWCSWWWAAWRRRQLTEHRPPGRRRVARWGEHPRHGRTRPLVRSRTRRWMVHTMDRATPRTSTVGDSARLLRWDGGR
jgi:hypothetical protein